MLILVAMLYVEKDLAQTVKVMFDKWDTHKEKLNHQYFYVANCRLSPREYMVAMEKSTSPRDRSNISHRTKVYIYMSSDDRCSRSRYHVHIIQRYRNVRH